MRENRDIREYAKSKGVFLYEVANALHISEPTITRWLRADMSKERRMAVLGAIDRVAAQNAVNLSTATA